jgi:predicted HTH transcriptional regulator
MLTAVTAVCFHTRVTSWEAPPLLMDASKDLTPQLAITFHSIDGKDLCRVAIHPSPRPAFIKEGQFEHLYIRTGNSTRLLTTKEAIDYCKTRWK